MNGTLTSTFKEGALGRRQPDLTARPSLTALACRDSLIERLGEALRAEAISVGEARNAWSHILRASGWQAANELLKRSGLSTDNCAFLQSGSLANSQAHPGSDLDFVLMFSETGRSNVYRLRDALIAHAQHTLKCNIDFILLSISKSSVRKPWDFIDRNIAATGVFLSGNESLALVQRYVALNPIEVLTKNVIQHQAGRLFAAATTGLKHAPGGRRDIMRAKQAIETLLGCDGPTPGLLKLLRRAETLKSGLLDAATHDSLIPNSDIARVASEAAGQRLQEGLELFEHVHSLMQDRFLTVRQRRFMACLDQRKRSCQPFTKSDIVVGLKNPEHRYIILWWLTYCEPIDEELLAIAGACGWLGYMALVANAFTPDYILRAIADIPGYRYRNVRDQIPKHPNASIATLQCLAQSNLEFTRSRAREVLAARLGMNDEVAATHGKAQ